MNNLNYDLATIKSFIDLATESLENQKKYLKGIYDKDLQQWVSYESNICLVEAAISYLGTAIELIQSCQVKNELDLEMDDCDLEKLKTMMFSIIRNHPQSKGNLITAYVPPWRTREVEKALMSLISEGKICVDTNLKFAVTKQWSTEEDLRFLFLEGIELTDEEIKELSNEGLDLSKEFRKKIEMMHHIPAEERLAKS